MKYRKRWVLCVIMGLLLSGGVPLFSQIRELVPSDVYVSELDPADFKETRLTEEALLRETDFLSSYRMSYQVDGLELYGLLNIPKRDAPEGGFPVIILCHGYIPSEKYSTLNSYTLVDTFYAEAGFVTFKPDYRGLGDSPTASSSVMDRVAYARDVLAALAGVRKLGYVNAEALFLYGHSLGGDVALRVLAATSVFKGASIWAPVYQPFPESLLFYARKSGSAGAEAQRLRLVEQEFDPSDYPLVSTKPFLDRIQTPVILHQGTQDRSVPYQWSVDLKNDLEALGKPVTFYSYQADHNISQYFTTVRQRDVDFFRAQLLD